MNALWSVHRTDTFGDTWMIKHKFEARHKAILYGLLLRFRSGTTSPFF